MNIPQFLRFSALITEIPPKIIVSFTNQLKKLNCKKF
jgi:hypothetical protein